MLDQGSQPRGILTFESHISGCSSPAEDYRAAILNWQFLRLNSWPDRVAQEVSPDMALIHMFGSRGRC